MWQKLQQFLQDMPNIAIAFSGGLDSRFLAYAAKLAGCNVLLLHAKGVHIPAQESEYARMWAYKQGLKLKCIDVDVLSLELVQSNSKQRCYYCKKYLFNTFMSAAEGFVLCDGTNCDDKKSYRPGLLALEELGIVSPLHLCGLSKANIRSLAVENELDNHLQKARPCLLTRFNYGLNVTQDMLFRVSSAELDLENAGLVDFRLRICPEPVLQTLKHNLQDTTIEHILGKHGFNNVKIIMSDSISGFFDQAQQN